MKRAAFPWMTGCRFYWVKVQRKLNGHTLTQLWKNMTMLVSSKCCMGYDSKMRACHSKLRFCSRPDSLNCRAHSSVFFGFMLVGWVVQLCQWHLSCSCMQSSPLSLYTFLWPNGASVSRLWEHFANWSWQWLQPAPSPCSALVSPHCCVGRQKKRPFKIEVCILWRKTDVQKLKMNRQLERETDRQMA